jgi:glycosyltransferase involved in cell wall biosynthesis
LLGSLVTELRLTDAVTFLGQRDDVPDLLAASDVLAFPSLWEGAAGTLQEAMALECPIVTSELPTILETVDESIAELVPPGDAAALARGLISALRNQQVSTRRVEVGRRRFEREFTIDVCAHRMADLYFRTAVPS